MSLSSVHSAGQVQMLLVSDDWYPTTMAIRRSPLFLVSEDSDGKVLAAVVFAWNAVRIRPAPAVGIVGKAMTGLLAGQCDRTRIDRVGALTCVRLVRHVTITVE